jgi:hypothetical protein
MEHSDTVHNLQGQDLKEKDLVEDLDVDGAIRQAMYVESNIETRSRNHCCSGKAMSITYSLCVSVALIIRHAMRMRHVVICDNIFPHYLINGTVLRKTSY